MKRQFVVCVLACMALWGCGGGEPSGEPDAGPPTVNTPTEKAPGAPEEVSVSPGDGQVTVSWKAPREDGGRPVTDYTVTVQSGTAVVKSPSTRETSAVIDGLTNGTEYTFTVKATNSVGTGSASRAVAAVPRTLPGAASRLSAEERDQEVLLTWMAPATGGSAIIKYTVTGSPGDIVLDVPGSDTQARVTGLTNGTAYTFTVKATNAVGDGPLSAPLPGVRPKGAPGALSRLVATAYNGRVVVQWGAPQHDGGRALSGYTVTTSVDGRVVDTTTTEALTVSLDARELTNGVEYAFTVTANNEVGSGPSSTVRETPYSTPGVPTPTSVTGGNAQARFSWSAAEPNGRPVLDYTVFVYQVQSGIPALFRSVTVPGTDTSVVVPLVNGYYYLFTIEARNIAGKSQVSARSEEAIVWTSPTAPTVLSTSPINQGVSLTWQRPADNGGNEVFRYILRAYANGVVAATSEARGDQTSGAIGNLVNGRYYDVTVSAVNRAGESPESSPVRGQAMDVPGHPEEVTAQAGNGRVTLRWKEPEYTGGGVINQYWVYVYEEGGSTTPVDELAYYTEDKPMTSLVVESLTNGRSYYFYMRAENRAGRSIQSARSNTVTPMATVTAEAPVEEPTASP